ncbi:MAG: short-chain dehydrogenase [Rhodospirillales bacterium]|nr:short-chain dehydrogenase [Rhodospirillales bacterium]
MASSTDGVLAGKVALVTGGNSGIGAAAVRMLADAGASVVVGYNNGLDRARALIEQLPGANHLVQRIVLEDAATVRAAAAAIGDRYGRADILVNSAGFTRPIPHADLDALDDDFMDRMLIANVRGPFSMIRALTPLLRASGDGVIVNVSSVSGFTGSGSNIAYCAAKGALDTMSLALARALGPEIRVLCVSPAAVATDFVAGRDRAALEKQAQAVPLKRVVEPEDVARAIIACITHLTAATGTTIVVDAGRHL